MPDGVTGEREDYEYRDVTHEDAEEWKQFLLEYVAKNGMLDNKKPPAVLDKFKKVIERSPNFRKSDDGILLSPDHAHESLKHFIEHGYMAAPLGPTEHDRRRVLRRFELDSRGKRKNIDRILDTVKLVFNMPIVVVSAVLEDDEVFISTLGWEEEQRVQELGVHRVPLKAAFCPHALTKPFQRNCFLVPSAKDDWRFANNPYVIDNGPIQSFVSANVFLPASTPARADSDELPIGALCLISKESQSENWFSEKNQKLLRTFADLVARELMLELHSALSEKAVEQSVYLGDLLRDIFVNPTQPPHEIESAATFDKTSRNLQDLTKASFVGIVDLRAFHAPPPPSPANSPSNEPTGGGSLSRPSLRRLESSNESNQSQWNSGDSVSRLKRIPKGQGTLTWLGKSAQVEWEIASEWGRTVEKTLETYYKDGEVSHLMPSAVSPILPKDATAALIIPIFDPDKRPCLFVVVGSTERYFVFEKADEVFTRNVGAVVFGSLMRIRMINNDKAKLTYVSQISHELRTPLHGVASNVELIRAMSEPAHLRVIEPFLDVADVCISSLREVIDDTLLFSKLSHNTNGATRKAALVDCDLEKLVEDVFKGCYARHNQTLRAISDKPDSIKDHKVQLIVETKGRISARVDVGGLKRVLFNLVGNSLKFTEEGRITVSVEALPKRPDGDRKIKLTVADTGKGMSEDFLVNKLFTPFQQGDSFTTGAGLGISICDTIIKRMNGSLDFESAVGKGTTATIVVPLENVTLSEEDGENITRSRIISDELASMTEMTRTATRQSRVSTRPPTPAVLDDDANSLLDIPVSHAVAQSLSDLIKMKVLVVDDNQIARKVLSKMLSSKNIEYREAQEGAEAIEVFRSFRPCIVWCDEFMPGMDGLQVAQALREVERAERLAPAHIVILSGDGQESFEEAKGLLEDGTVNEWHMKGGAQTMRALSDGLEKRRIEIEERKMQLSRLESVIEHVKRGGALPEVLRLPKTP